MGMIHLLVALKRGTGNQSLSKLLKKPQSLKNLGGDVLTMQLIMINPNFYNSDIETNERAFWNVIGSLVFIIVLSCLLIAFSIGS